MNNFDYCGGNDNASGYDMNALAKRYNKQTKQVNGFSKPVVRKRFVKQITPWGRLIMINIGFEDFEAVAGLKYGNLDDGAFHRAMIHCTKHHNILDCRSSVTATNSLTKVRMMHKEANDIVSKALERL